LLLLAACGEVDAPPAAAHTTERVGTPSTLADLRAGNVSIGTVVEVSGVITAVGTDRIVLQQAQTAGIMALVGNRASGFSPGDVVSVTGAFQRMAQWEILRVQAGDPIVLQGTSDVPAPVRVGWATVGNPTALEAYESMLVTLPRALQAPSPFTRSFLPMALQDPNNASRELVVWGLFWNPTADLGATMTDATGILGQYNAYRPILPRNLSDMTSFDRIEDVQAGFDFAGDGGGARGDDVVVEGIVGHDVGQYGFFLSSPDGGELSGVWVYLGNNHGLSVSAGDHVRVSAEVVEFDSFGSWAQPLTELVPPNNGAVSLVSSGNDLPTPTVIPASELATLQSAERWEGVLVTIEDPTLVVGTTPSFGEYTVVTSTGGTLTIDNELLNVDVLAGETLSRLTGYVHTSYGIPKIAPRDSGDWTLGAGVAADCDPATSAVLGTLNTLDDVGDYIDATWGEPFPCDYDDSREALYFDLHWDAGLVEGVYTGNTIGVVPGTLPNFMVFNTEHTWPRSWGPQNDPMNCDLHHLFPVDADANQARSNLQLDEVTNSVTWSQGGSRVGNNPFGLEVFEPRDEHKGNAARAILYYMAQYRQDLFRPLEPLYLAWHLADPVDDAERIRNAGILLEQGVSNPFITCPEIALQVIP
jgi:hypothetical protein